MEIVPDTISSIQLPPAKKLKTEPPLTKAMQKQAVMTMWIADSNRWLDMVQQCNDIYEKGWLYSLYNRSIYLMHEELTKVDQPSYQIEYPCNHWASDDINHTRRFVHSLHPNNPFRDYFQHTDLENILAETLHLSDISEANKENIDPSRFGNNP